MKHCLEAQINQQVLFQGFEVDGGLEWVSSKRAHVCAILPLYASICHFTVSTALPSGSGPVSRSWHCGERRLLSSDLPRREPWMSQRRRWSRPWHGSRVSHVGAKALKAVICLEMAEAGSPVTHWFPRRRAESGHFYGVMCMIVCCIGFQSQSTRTSCSRRLPGAAYFNRAGRCTWQVWKCSGCSELETSFRL